MISFRFSFVKWNALILLQKKGKLRMSSVKRSNLKHSKLSKQGKLKFRRHKKKSELLHKRNKNRQPKLKLPEEEEEQSDHGEELLQMVEKDDLEFLQNAVASHSYSLLNHIRYTE
jgi:nucleolar complex protein 3